MPSKQFAHLQATSAHRLRARIPSGCPLLVAPAEPRGFCVWTLDERDRLTARFEVVAAWIDGYVAAWSRLTRR